MQGRNLVVKIVSALVKALGVDGQGVFDKGRVNVADARRARRRVALFQQVEQAPGVAVGVTHEGRDGALVKLQMAQHLFLRTRQQKAQLVVGKRLEHINLRARQQGRIHLKRRVLGGGANQRHQARLGVGQERVLLRLVKAVDFVHKQNRVLALRQMGLRLFHGRAYVFDPREHRRQGDELAVKTLRSQARQRGFTHARRAPQNHGMRLARGKGELQRLARAQHIALAYHLCLGAGAQRFGQGRGGFGWKEVGHSVRGR